MAARWNTVEQPFPLREQPGWRFDEHLESMEGMKIRIAILKLALESASALQDLMASLPPGFNVGRSVLLDMAG